MRASFMLPRTVPLLLAVWASVCPQSASAQSKEVATVIELEGRVSVMRGGEVALFLNNAVSPKEVIVTGPDGHAIFRIADGSTFEVFPNSRVAFQAQWTLEDMLEVILGKIRVQIEHRNGPNKKKVSTPTAVISVRGTIFDIDVEDPDGTTLVSVEEGEILVKHRLQPGDPVVLDPPNSLRIFPDQPLAKAAGQGQGLQYLWDQVKNAVVNVALRNPGGVVLPGNGGVPTGQGDSGKGNKNPPTSAPPNGGH